MRGRRSPLNLSVFRASLLAVGLLLVAAQTGPLQAGANGRDHSRCVTACNATHQTCKGNCRANCQELFPTDKEARAACVGECTATCKTERDDCKLICEENKFPPTPSEP